MTVRAGGPHHGGRWMTVRPAARTASDSAGAPRPAEAQWTVSTPTVCGVAFAHTALGATVALGGS